MRVALVGWDTDEAVLDALAQHGVELVVFTRWFPQAPLTELRRGWRLERCPHQLRELPEQEAHSFRDSVLDREAKGAAEASWASFDLVHALDAMGRLAAAGLAERYPASARVGSLSAPDLRRPEPPAWLQPDRWIADDPWVAERCGPLVGALGAPVDVVATRRILERQTGEASGGVQRSGPLIACAVPAVAEVDPGAPASALASLRGEFPGLSARVLGIGPAAARLHRALGQRNLLGPGGERWDDVSAWVGALAGAAVVALAHDEPADSPIAWAAWSLGVPVVRLTGANASALRESLRRALQDRRCFESEVRAGAALAARQFAPEGVALGWLKSYLKAAVTPPRGETPTVRKETFPLAQRTRLALVAVGPRELYASFHVRSDDRKNALDWLGRDAVHATLALRMQDITAIAFNGSNAHFSQFIDLSFSERFRSVHFDRPGCSFVGSLGLRSPGGHFHPLAHAGPVHLPREQPATNPPTRWLRSLPRTE
jgi:hypothetical protein